MTKSREWGYLSRRINKSLNPKVEYRGDGGEKPNADLLKRFLLWGESLDCSDEQSMGEVSLELRWIPWDKDLFCVFLLINGPALRILQKQSNLLSTRGGQYPLSVTRSTHLEGQLQIASITARRLVREGN